MYNYDLVGLKFIYIVRIVFIYYYYYLCGQTLDRLCV
jgi:hypothetical protein